MSYELHDEDGEIGSGPSNNGLSQLKKYVTDNGNHPALDMLLEHGVTHLIMKLSVECAALAEKCPDPNVKSSLVSLSKDAKKAKGVVILSSHGI